MVMGDADARRGQFSVVRRLSSVICYRRTLVFLILPKIAEDSLCDEGGPRFGKGIEIRRQTTDCRCRDSFWLLVSDV
jgi:hypothetical protein